MSSGRVVLVEDDPDISLLVAMQLEDLGLDVEALHDGVAALEACRERPPDLVILDVSLPGMSGLEVCRALRSTPELAHVGIVLLTARAAESDVAAGRAAGADVYLVKPFRAEELELRVRSLLGA